MAIVAKPGTQRGLPNVNMMKGLRARLFVPPWLTRVSTLPERAELRRLQAQAPGPSSGGARREWGTPSSPGSGRLNLLVDHICVNIYIYIHMYALHPQGTCLFVASPHISKYIHICMLYTPRKPSFLLPLPIYLNIYIYVCSTPPGDLPFCCLSPYIYIYIHICMLYTPRGPAFVLPLPIYLNIYIYVCSTPPGNLPFCCLSPYI